MTTYVLGGGCFWCLDSSYSQFCGVTDISVGYMGGSLENPGYEAVCNGNTGHAEVAQITFDESVIPAEVILDIFFTLHDPRQLNRQGNDIGTQYRSCMFYADDSQREAFEAAKHRAAEIWDGEIVTEIVPAETYWRGEEYHHSYFEKNPGNGYCSAVINPKLQKLRAKFTSYLK